MQLFENISLIDKHTFHIDVKARYWIDFEKSEELITVFSNPNFKDLPVFTIGGGSNVLFNEDYSGLLIHSCIKGIEVISEDNEHVFVKVGSGYNWDAFVCESISRGWTGAENLSSIPGDVGASPVQNIGAYGVEAGDLIFSTEAYNIETGEIECFYNSDCRFSYRNSIFKNELKDKYVICSVTFKLSKVFKPVLNYGDLESRLIESGGISPLSVRNIIIRIRSEKLPDPDVTGNAGSFFMNPVISAEKYFNIKNLYPDLTGWIQKDGKYKISAAWCIEKAGWKGKTHGNAGVHPKQALVLVNNGNSTSKEIIELSGLICKDVNSKFGINLIPEVLILNSH
jgi:UDP-N-acetylmuramate dehydrogenase